MVLPIYFFARYALRKQTRQLLQRRRNVSGDVVPLNAASWILLVSFGHTSHKMLSFNFFRGFGVGLGTTGFTIGCTTVFGQFNCEGAYASVLLTRGLCNVL